MSDPAAICLALALYFEGRGESTDGQIAIAEVVVNRAESDRYPDHICEVVFQPKQFSFVTNNETPEPAEDSPQWVKALRLANAYLAAPKDATGLTGGSLWYHAAYVKPAWAAKLQRTVKIGNHIFYKEKK